MCCWIAPETPLFTQNMPQISENCELNHLFVITLCNQHKNWIAIIASRNSYQKGEVYYVRKAETVLGID